MTDEELVAKVLNKDQEAFDILYKKYYSRVTGAVAKVLLKKYPNDIDDIASTVMMKILVTKIHLFRGQSQFGTWVYRVAVNAALMYYRGQKSDVLRKAEPLEYTDNDSEGYVKIDVAVEDKEFGRVEAKLDLDKIFLSISQRNANFLKDRYIKGMSNKDCVENKSASSLIAAKARAHNAIEEAKETAIALRSKVNVL